MRKIVAGLFMSLDGVVQAPDGWQRPYLDDEMMGGIIAGIAQCDAILLGRRTYLEFAELWPGLGGDVPMADFMNRTSKYIVSGTLDTPLAWANSRLITGDLAEAVAKLKAPPGKNILIPGSPTLVRSLLRDGLLDELSLNILPVVVGSGRRLFDELTERVRLELVVATPLGSGVLSVTYRPMPQTDVAPADP